MKSPEQLKGALRNFSKEKNLKSLEVLHMFFFERILERLSLSDYQSNFILKGGLLIASMIGIENRSTLDMDATVSGIPMEEEMIKKIIMDLFQIDVGDGIQFFFQKIESIREDDTYNNYRVHVNAMYGKIDAPMKIDITTGDAITPAAIIYSYKMFFVDKYISVMAYNIETILAEKFETIIRRNIGTTRARDFYDLHILFKSRYIEINKSDFIRAVENTAKKRGSFEYIKDWIKICEEIRNEPALNKLWNNYQKENHYASDLTFQDVTNNLLQVAQYLYSNENL